MKLFSHIALITTLCLLVGCGEKVEDPTVDTGAEPEPKAVVNQVVILGDLLSEDLRNAFETEGALREGVALEIAVDLGGDSERQREQLRRWAARGVDLFAIAFWDGSKAETVVQEANSLGIPVLVFGTESETYSGELIARIAADPYRGGQLAGMTMIEAVGESVTSLGIVDFTRGTLAEHRIRGIEDSLGRFDRSRLEGGPTLSKSPLPISLLAAESMGGLFVFTEDRLNPTLDALEKVGSQARTSVIGFGSGPIASEALSRGRVHALIQPAAQPLAASTFSVIDAVFSEGEVVPVKWVEPTVLFRRDRPEGAL